MVEVIPMGINIPPNREWIAAEARLVSVAPSTILFIGRLTEIKGLAVLLKATEGLDGVRLIVAGYSEARDEHQRMARQLSLDARFIGRIGASEREHLFSICDVVVIPSIVLPDGRSEGTPVVCLEAMAAGRAVIASRIGGLAEIIRDGENGLLFEQGDDRMLREKLTLVLSDQNLRQEIAENARRSAAAYDWARIGSRYGAIIKTALRKNDVIGNRGIEASRIRG
jgi:glycosyltransferase involved in cell wall biosynthesis